MSPFRSRTIQVEESVLRRILDVLEGVGSVSPGLWPELYAVKTEIAGLVDVVIKRTYWCDACRTWLNPARGETIANRCSLCGGSAHEVVSTR